MSQRGAIFDMDGLLIDSEVLWHEAEVEILVPLGAAIDGEATRSTKGMFVAEVVRHYHDAPSWSGPGIDIVVAMILERVGNLVETKGRLLPGAAATLERCASLGPVALASSTPTALIMRSLSHFGLAEAFSVIHSAEDEPFGKPHPGVFLTAAARLGVATRSCLVFEDSAAGVLAAKAARMSCVAVPVAQERDHAVFGIADVVLDSLVDLDDEWLRSWYDGSVLATTPGGPR